MAHVIGVGTDIVEIRRIGAALDRHGERFREKAFTPAETAYCLSRAEPPAHFAGRFAAKEAVLKALGCGFGRGASLTDVEIVSGDRAPVVTLSGGAARIAKAAGAVMPVLVSISHSREAAIAFAVVQGHGGSGGPV